MVTIFPINTLFNQYKLVKKYMSIQYLHVLFGFRNALDRIILLLYFFFITLTNDRVIVQLNQSSPGFLNIIKKIFGQKLRYIMECEGDTESERDFLLKHPYKPHFYDSYINSAHDIILKQQGWWKKSDYIFVLSPNLKDLMVKRYPELNLQSKMMVLSTGVDCRRLYFSDKIREQTRKNLRLENRFILLFLGSAYYSWQNVYRTLELFQLVKKQLVPNAFMLLLIRKVDHPIAKEFIDKLEISPTDYLLSSTGLKDMIKYINAADLGILLRHNHIMNQVASPGKFGEYLACGLPIIMTKGISNFAERIEKTNMCIVLNDMDDDKEILTKIQPFLKYDNVLRQKLSEWAKNNISLESYADDYKNALLKIARA